MSTYVNQYPMKGIINTTSNSNFSYAHSVLQSLSCLDVTKEFVKLVVFENINPNFLLTKELYALIFVLNGGEEGLSNDIIRKFKDCYEKNKANIQSPNVLKEDPFHFLFFLLQFTHLESNVPKNPNYDINLLTKQSLNNKQNDDFMFKLFTEFFNQTQNSLIAENFFNIERYLYQCPNCNQYFNYGMKTVLRIDVEDVRKYANSNNTMYSMTNFNKINLGDCFNNYNDKINTSCENCGNQSTSKWVKICIPARVLIIVFERKNHPFNNDINFPVDLNMNPFVSQKINNMLHLNTNYALSSCISYDHNLKKYFADCCIKSQNGNSFYRFINDQIMPININDIYQYEPQVLIYELKNQNNNQNNYVYLQNTMNNNNNSTNNINNVGGINSMNSINSSYSSQYSNLYSNYQMNSNNQISNQFINSNINNMMV